LCASSNSGQIANAAVDIWLAEGVDSVLKYEDDLNLFHCPVQDGAFLNNHFRYNYDYDTALSIIQPLGIPWHRKKGTQKFHHIITFISLEWNLHDHTVTLPEKKRLKFLQHCHSFIANFSSHPCTLNDIDKIHSSLSYISIVYPHGRSYNAPLSSFASSFRTEFQTRRPPPLVLSSIQWWISTLEMVGSPRLLIPRGDVIDLGIFVNASTSWGIGVVISGQWTAFRLAPDWKIPRRDICWLETLAVKFAVYYLEKMGFQNSRLLIHLDNQGTIGALDKGRSSNVPINLAVCRTYTALAAISVSVDINYIASADNPADPISRGILGPLSSKLNISFHLPKELISAFIHYVHPAS